MFKEKFKSEFEKIKPTDESKASVLKMLLEKTESSSPAPLKRVKRARWVAVLAAVLAVCIVSVTVLNLPFFSSPLVFVEDIEFKNGIPASVTYDQIYKKFVEGRRMRVYPMAFFFLTFQCLAVKYSCINNYVYCYKRALF